MVKISPSSTAITYLLFGAMNDLVGVPGNKLGKVSLDDCSAGVRVENILHGDTYEVKVAITGNLVCDAQNSALPSVATALASFLRENGYDVRSASASRDFINLTILVRRETHEII